MDELQNATMLSHLHPNPSCTSLLTIHTQAGPRQSDRRGRSLSGTRCEAWSCAGVCGRRGPPLWGHPGPGGRRLDRRTHHRNGDGRRRLFQRCGQGGEGGHAGWHHQVRVLKSSSVFCSYGCSHPDLPVCLSTVKPNVSEQRQFARKLLNTANAASSQSFLSLWLTSRLYTLSKHSWVSVFVPLNLQYNVHRNFSAADLWTLLQRK